MSFLLRRVAVTADGREIIRATPVDATELTVGRDAASTIHLPDLALNPQHARITQIDATMIEVTALSSLGFECDGATQTNVRIDARNGAELRFGGHRITVGMEEDAGGARIALTIARTDELSHSALDRDEAKAFSLAGLLPGRRLSAWGFSVLILLAFLAAPIWAYFHFKGVEHRPHHFHADMSWSSGPLSSAHASLARDCQSCHVDAFVSVRDSACQSCHKDAHDHAPLDRVLRARAAPGLWQGTLNRIAVAFNRPQGRCVDCHTEHEGAGPMPPTAQRFCTDCHASLSTRLTDTKIGNAGDFGTAHPEFRPRVALEPGITPRFGRVTLTPTVEDRNGLKFPHALHLLPSGGVARMARNLHLGNGQMQGLGCASCHRPTADGVRFEPVNMERDCQACHSLAFETVGGVSRTLRHGEPQQVVADLYAYYRSTPPARPINLGGMARRRPGGFEQGEVYNIYFREVAVRPNRAADAVRAVFSKDGACYDCHTIFPPIAGNSAWRVLPVHQQTRYYNHGWFNHRAHEKEKCGSCHAAERSHSATQLLVPGIANCRDCHGGEGSHSDVPSPCAMCHEYHRAPQAARAPWRPAGDHRRRDSAAMTDVTEGRNRSGYDRR